MNALRILALLLLIAPGCGPRTPIAPPVPADGAESSFPQTVTDSLGFTATLPTRPVRIISTAPANTEILFAIGAGDQVIADTTFCTYPPEADKRPKIGGFAPKTISTETILGLAPDLVLTTGGFQQEMTDGLRNLKLPVLSYDAKTLDEVVRNVRQLGVVTGRAPEANALADRLVARAEAVRKRTAAVPVEQRPRVLLLLGVEPLATAGPKSFTGEILELAGGRNLFADADQVYVPISEEEIVRRNPDAVVLWQMGEPIERVNRIAQRPAWKDLTAVRQNRILHIDDDLLSRPGPRLFDGLEQLAEQLHPQGHSPGR
ncbi:ABC transporter substrate-binding protein [Limnoglobus roseus]|uniref:ABC transporter substrate-binding protein n=1 Tax=Limnoglobus roseus TaxID=2598579 RepID=UPI00143CF018|nr:cobalamin-binding protein [Limnoglobus roseus]